jgi:tRNA(Arg) A34 adenosine deaminase TadA
VATGNNQVTSNLDPTAHAEVTAMRAAIGLHPHTVWASSRSRRSAASARQRA